jgi:hypothetical protein
MGKLSETRVDKILKWFNNNKIFSVIIIMALVIIALGHFVDGFNKIKSAFFTESPTITPSTRKSNIDSKDTSKAGREPDQTQKLQKTYEVTLVLPSRMSDAEILIDGKPAAILERTLTVVKIGVEEKRTAHEIMVKKGNVSCVKRQWIRKSGEIFYPCQ